jgi:hypothetical protein
MQFIFKCLSVFIISFQAKNSIMSILLSWNRYNIQRIISVNSLFRMLLIVYFDWFCLK